jgi:hypothetical protein
MLSLLLSTAMISAFAQPAAPDKYGTAITNILPLLPVKICRDVKPAQKDSAKPQPIL